MDLVLLVLRSDFFFPRPNCFQNVFVPTFFANFLNFLRPLPTSAVSGAAFSNKSALILFAVGTILFLIKGIAVLPKILAIASKPLQRNL